jgi:uncharacterized phage-associated protein
LQKKERIVFSLLNLNNVMKTNYEIDKIKAVVLYILKKSGGTLDYITLFKKMYFAQQLFLVRYGRLLFNDSFRAVKLGPVPSFTYKSFRASLECDGTETEDIKKFDSSFIVKEEDRVKYVSAKDDPDMDELAEAEVEVLNEVISRTQGMTPSQLSDLSHDYAWKVANERAKNDSNDNYISIVNIARAGGANKAMLDYIRQNQTFHDFCRE